MPLDKRLKYWHILDVNGENTPGVQPVNWDLYKFPKDLFGKDVLDIGAKDGGYAITAARHKARYVWAMDICTNLVFLHLKSELNIPDVYWRTCSVYDLPLSERYDLVIALGLLYHLRHPLLALEKLGAITKELCILETITDMHDVSKPAMAFYPGAEYAGDPTNWVGPNKLLLEAWFKDVGFKSWTLVHENPGRVCYHLLK